MELSRQGIGRWAPAVVAWALLLGLEVQAAQLSFHVFDVGEGMAVGLRSGNQGLLIDTGPVSYSARLLKQMRSVGITKLHGVVLTHLHEDHSSGWFRLREQWPGMKTWWNCHMPAHPTAIMAWLKQEWGSPPCLKKGDQLSWEGFKLKVLWPGKLEGGDLNKNSLVVEVRAGKQSFLIMGDATKEVERKLRIPSTWTVLVAGHHGASDTGDPNFLKNLRAQAVVVPVNDGNRYGRPATPVVKLLKAVGPVHLTGRDGAYSHSIH